MWSGVAMPASHLPTWCVLYPAARIFVAMPVMFRGIPAKPETGSAALRTSAGLLRMLTCVGRRPDCRLERVGEQKRNA